MVGMIFGLSEEFDDAGNDRALFFGGNFLHHRIGQRYEIVKVGELLAELLGFRTRHGFRALDAICKDRSGWFRLAPFALASDDAEDFPNVFLGLIEIFALPTDDDLSNEPPVCEFSKVGVGVSSADLEFAHYFVGIKGVLGDHKKGMDHSHGSIDAPLTAKRSPLGNEVILDFLEILIHA